MDERYYLTTVKSLMPDPFWQPARLSLTTVNVFIYMGFLAKLQ
jgi:hypothetical protein